MEKRSFEMKSAQTRGEAANTVETATKKMENWQKKALFATEQHDVIKARNVELEGWHKVYTPCKVYKKNVRFHVCWCQGWIVVQGATRSPMRTASHRQTLNPKP